MELNVRDSVSDLDKADWYDDYKYRRGDWSTMEIIWIAVVSSEWTRQVEGRYIVRMENGLSTERRQRLTMKA